MINLPYINLSHRLLDDYIDVGSMTLKMLRFELRDARGNLVDLKGCHWSMTPVFARK